MMLVIDCCIRGDDSATRRYYEAYLQAAGKAGDSKTGSYETSHCAVGWQNAAKKGMPYA